MTTSFNWLSFALGAAVLMTACGEAQPSVSVEPASDGAKADAHRDGHSNVHPGEHADSTPKAHDAHHDDDGPVIVKLNRDQIRNAKVTTEVVRRQSMAVGQTTTGEVDFDQDAMAHVSPRLAGRVARVHAELGDDVKPGAWLLRLDSIEIGRAKATYLKAKAAAEVARLMLAQEEQLLKDEVTSKREVIEARGRWRSAETERQASHEMLRLYGLNDDAISKVAFGDAAASLVTVRAPIAGTIVDKRVTRGELVTPERVTFTIADLSTVWVWIDVFERELPNVHEGDAVEVRLDSAPGQVYRGAIDYIRDEVDRETRTVQARVTVENTDRRLKPGMFASVRLRDVHNERPEMKSDDLVVPTSALVEVGTQTAVFVARNAGEFERRVVETGRAFGGVVEVTAGLTEGERVVTTGTFFLKSESSQDALGAAGHAH